MLADVREPLTAEGTETTIMILGAEIALTIMGLLLLIRGKGLGKDALPHRQYRWLGGFMLTMFPVALGVMLVFAVVWAMTHPGMSIPELEQSARWPATGIEFVIVVAYAIAGSVWEKAIKRKALAEQTSGVLAR